MTPIDDVLESLRLQSTIFCRMTLIGEWGLAKPALAGAPFHLILSGEAWLERGEDELIRLGPGDLVVLPHGDAHDLLSAPRAETVPFTQVSTQMGLEPWTPGTRYRAVDFRFGRGSGTTTLISGVFAFGDRRRNPLLEALPPVMLITADNENQATRAIFALCALLDDELLSGVAGAESVCGRLADILFIQVVRHYLSASTALPRGWLKGISDPQIAPALGAMQRSPEQPWSVATLASEAGMSRSRFAARFQEVVGRPPLDYLTDWRMHQAAASLRPGGPRLASIAQSVGYRSEVAFSKAFRRWAGHSPAEYRKRP